MVKRAAIHPNYNLEARQSGDVALLELEVPATLSTMVQLACLPKKADLKNINFDGREVFVRYIL